jgi:hypothetical protein
MGSEITHDVIEIDCALTAALGALGAALRAQGLQFSPLPGERAGVALTVLAHESSDVLQRVQAALNDAVIASRSALIPDRVGAFGFLLRPAAA